MTPPNDPAVAAIRAALMVLEPSLIEIRDDGALHAGHPGARGGGGHYHIEIEAACFAGKTGVARHRQIYAALGDLMSSSIHALAIAARAPGEDASAREPGARSTPLQN